MNSDTGSLTRLLALGQASQHRFNAARFVSQQQPQDGFAVDVIAEWHSPDHRQCVRSGSDCRLSATKPSLISSVTDLSLVTFELSNPVALREITPPADRCDLWFGLRSACVAMTDVSARPRRVP